MELIKICDLLVREDHERYRNSAIEVQGSEGPGHPAVAVREGVDVNQRVVCVGRLEHRARGFELCAREDLYQTVHLLWHAIDWSIGMQTPILEAYVVGERLVL